MNLRSYKILVIFFFISGLVFSQSNEIEKLKKKRIQYQTEIKNAERLLSKKGKSKISYLNELKILNSKIASQNNVIADV